ncbi:hypothetical protein SAMN04489761_1242 [Tenacibaculum sp. MAR_2009_124]|uniref:hypothetical protein n=1 Tax=Tenacibaculum sp. MAR_2009_124 TaxID=1250059 RepID=UPI00089CD321|nr:hypothetical protein [Tenacibaculum sp. MAR_2009_124]SEB53069.1 hypothetical protein SAMN04489761_1242 [Tenacibaculum sp. MAR_2009_124]
MKKLLHIASLLFTICSYSQESVFYSTNQFENGTSSKFNLEVYNLNFIKNNEYFNFIADGYTLLGSQVYPQVQYNNSKNTRFKAGVFIQKNFGENKIENIVPTFSFQYINGNHEFIIGNFFARNNHGTIEPILASEKILRDDVIETGLQYKYKSSKLSLNTWLNWENYIRPDDDFKEVFTFGISANINATKNLTFPVQFITRHKGGQINKKVRDELNIIDIYDIHNLATGVKYNFKLNTNNQFIVSYYYLLHTTNAPLAEHPFSNGNANYFKLRYLHRNFNFMLSYFKSNKFVTALGNDMFNSYSLKIDNNYWNGELDNRYENLQEPNRELIFAKAFYENSLAKNIKIGVQLEGFFQLNDSTETLVTQENKKNNFDYSYGVYVRFNDLFKL